MATVQYAHFSGPGGFSRPVAIKRLHPHFANDPGFASAFLDEARLSARIAHANVVATLDVLASPEDISVVMEYVHGETLAGLLGLARTRGTPLPAKIATSLLAGVLHGLHSAHETRGEHGEPLGIVHRDVSPENILVGSDGIARLLDFGIAKAKGRSRTTPTGELKGKLGYMAPEQYHGSEVDRRVDVYGASVVLWEALTGQVLFDGANDAAVVHAVMNSVVRAPSEFVPNVPPALDALVLRGLARDRGGRFESAREMALALEREVGLATQSEVSDWLQGIAGALLEERAAALAQLRRRREEHRTQAAGELGTRRLELDLAAGVLTRAAAADSAPAQTAHASESGLRARKTGRRRRWGVVLLGGLAAGVWLAWSFGTSSAPAAPRAATAPEARMDPPVPPTAETPREAAALASPPPGASDVPSQDARAQRPAKPAREAGKPAAKGRAKSARKKVDCAQPYVVDALGIRRWKRECL
jgi:hypothetical protein